MRVTLFGANVEKLRPLVQAQSSLELVEDDPDVVICYGGDGTLLSAELRWPGTPKAPIRNSKRGVRMIAHPPEQVIERLAANRLVPAQFIKLACERPNAPYAPVLRAMNEINVHLGRTNIAVRYKVWIDDEPFEQGAEIIGDGFLISTPFGSTAYYRQITRGIFYAGLGIAFKNTSELVNHVVVPESAVIRVEITRGPAFLAHDNAPESYPLDAGDILLVHKDPQNAVILSWEPLKRQSHEF